MKRVHVDLTQVLGGTGLPLRILLQIPTGDRADALPVSWLVKRVRALLSPTPAPLLRPLALSVGGYFLPPRESLSILHNSETVVMHSLNNSCLTIDASEPLPMDYESVNSDVKTSKCVGSESNLNQTIDSSDPPEKDEPDNSQVNEENSEQHKETNPARLWEEKQRALKLLGSLELLQDSCQSSDAETDQSTVSVVPKSTAQLSSKNDTGRAPRRRHRVRKRRPTSLAPQLTPLAPPTAPVTPQLAHTPPETNPVATIKKRKIWIEDNTENIVDESTKKKDLQERDKTDCSPLPESNGKLKESEIADLWEEKQRALSSLAPMNESRLSSDNETSPSLVSDVPISTAQPNLRGTERAPRRRRRVRRRRPRSPAPQLTLEPPVAPQLALESPVAPQLTLAAPQPLLSDIGSVVLNKKKIKWNEDGTELEVPQAKPEAPQPTVGAPQPTVEAPQPTVEAPQPTVEAPQSTVEAPQSTVEATQSTVEAPQSTAKAPQTMPEAPTLTPVTPAFMRQEVDMGQLVAGAGAARRGRAVRALEPLTA